MKNVEIKGIGVYLPPTIRTNSYWPRSVVEKWQSQTAGQATRAPDRSDKIATDGMRRVMEGFQKVGSDPFRGTKERRVMGAGETALDMETRAAQEALADADLASSDIDLVLSFSLCPDFINVPQACALHQRLNMSPKCFAMDATAVCNSFQAQLFLARGMIASGQVRNALLVQSSAMSRMDTLDEPQAMWFGDGATAVVVAGTDAETGILSMTNRTASHLWKALVHGIPNSRWFEAGKVVMYSEDRESARRMLFDVADMAREVLHDAMGLAQIAPSDVHFYAAHQSTAFMQDVTKQHSGLSHAQSVETFSWAGSLSAANIPLALSIAKKEGILRRGDNIALFSPGTGTTYTGSIIRWSQN